MPPIRTPPPSRASANDSTQVNTASRLVVDEILCFIQNKIDTLTELDIINICSTAYSEDDIDKSRRLLCELVGKRTTRKGDGSGKRNIQEIIKILKEYDDDVLPEFVARDLNRLPPVTFDHVDVTAFLKELTVLRRDVALLKESTETPQQSHQDFSALREEISSLKREIREMRLCQHSELPTHFTIAPPPARTELPTRPPPPLPAATPSSLPCASAPPAPHLPPAEPPAPHRPPPAAAPPGSRRPATTAPPEPHRSATAPPAPRRPACDVTDTAAARPAPPRPAPSGDAIVSYAAVAKREMTAWTPVEKRKPRRRENLRGKDTADSSNFKAVERLVSIYISRVDPVCSSTDIVDYVQNKTGLIVNVEKLSSRNDTGFNAYKVTVPGQKVGVFLDANTWPDDIVFRRYREGRKPSGPAAHV